MASKLTVNGVTHEVAADADTPLLWVLRDVLGLTGTSAPPYEQNKDQTWQTRDIFPFGSLELPPEATARAENPFSEIHHSESGREGRGGRLLRARRSRPARSALHAAMAGLTTMAVLAFVWQMRTVAQAEGNPVPVAADGTISVPEGYPDVYQHLGSWAVAADDGAGSSAMHIVCASPGTISAYRATGRFPSGAVLGKEVFETATDPMTTGLVSRAGSIRGWFVMVKAAEGEHPKSNLWGDGWGWSWFNRDDPKHTTSSDYRSDCKGCHAPAQETD